MDILLGRVKAEYVSTERVVMYIHVYIRIHE